jgi:hypothetical protein
MTGAVTATQVGSSPRCRSCGAAIWFGLTAKGRRMPLDPSPVEDGNVVMDRLERQQVHDLPHVRVLGKGEDVGDTPRYVAHFSTCPDAERHRRRNRRPGPTVVGSTS